MSDGKPWMTPSVKGLLAGIVSDSAYDRLYILADALEEGGFAEVDPEALLAMRSNGFDDILYDPGRLTRVVNHDAGYVAMREAEARLTDLAARIHDWQYDFPTDENGEELEKPEDVTWDDWYDRYRVANEGQTLEWLLEVLGNYCETGDSECLWFDTPEFLYDEAATMWKDYETLTGRSPAAVGDPTSYRYDRYEAPFRCAC